MSTIPVSKLPPVGGVQPTATKPAERIARDGTARDSFETALTSALDNRQAVTFSAHAQSRLISRNICLNASQLARLTHGVDQAASKGARDSLVVLDQLALVVSVPNRKVITAVDSGQFSGSVFTQIDSAVIV